MRKFISCLIALCLLLTPLAALADAANTSYFWVSDTQFDMYDLGFSIVMPEGWKRADDETIANMNAEFAATDETAATDDAATTDAATDDAATTDATTNDAATADAATTALQPTVIAMITNADESVQLLITTEVLDSALGVDTSDKYMELFANDIIATDAGDGVTYSYDMTTVADATLAMQTFRELAVAGSDGTLVDLLVCYSGIGSFYTFAITGTQESITAFATEFVNSIQEIESVG